MPDEKAIPEKALFINIITERFKKVYFSPSRRLFTARALGFQEYRYKKIYGKEKERRISVEIKKDINCGYPHEKYGTEGDRS